MYLRLTLTVILFSILQTGCSTIAPIATEPIGSSMVANNGTTNSYESPARMATIWKEKIMRPQGEKPVRGFTGRLYFYNTNDQLVRVQGELVVYGYDDSVSSDSEIADREYVFPAEKFNTHYSKSELGHSYTVWIPWQKYDGFRKSILLVPLFKTNNNQIIKGDSNRLSLSGRASDPRTFEKTILPQLATQNGNRHAERNTNYADSQQPNLTGNSRHQHRVETFQLPPSMTNRMVNIPTNRIPSRKYPDMDSPQINPNGELFNQVRYENSQSRVPGELPRPQTQSTPNNSNFSDSANIEATRTEKASKIKRIFGKPGSFR